MKFAEDKTSLGSVIPLYLGFAATGVGVALPGVLLPVLLSRWHLTDEQGGRLFLMAWIGSSLGALAIRRSLRRALILGSFGVALGALGLAISNGNGVYALMALYGLGLGTTMTSISLIRQHQTAGSGTEMVRLNLVWAIGASVCPSLTLHALRGENYAPILLGVCACFALLGASSMLQPAIELAVASQDRFSLMTVFRRIPLPCIAMIFLITGVEASAGAWLATYTGRSAHLALEAIAAPTCLWAGLLLSRLFWTVAAGRFPERKIVLWSLLLMAASSSLLIATGVGVTILIAAFFLGVGIGPTYPLLLGWALRIQPGGAIFFVAGAGSACLPWLTGVISAHKGSLRAGMAVPLAGVLAMLVMCAVSGRGDRQAPGLSP